MPFFLLPLVPALIAWGSRALAVYGLSRLFSEQSVQELYDMLINWVVGEVASRSGLQLDPENPFSDASMAGAVGQKLGFAVRSLKDPVLIREDLDTYAAALVSQKSGYQISSVTNVTALKADLERVAVAVMTDRVGIPLGNLGAVFDPAAARQQILIWAKAELLANIGGEAGLVVSEIVAAGGLEVVVGEINSRLGELGSLEAVTARQLAVRASERMASSAVADFGRVAVGMDKKNRARALGRAAQAKFRAAHGNRSVYVPLGMNATVV